jgi:hypothetical protein
MAIEIHEVERISHVYGDSANRPRSLTMYYLVPYKMPSLSRCRIRPPLASCQNWDLSPSGFFAVRLWIVLTRRPGLVFTCARRTTTVLSWGFREQVGSKPGPSYLPSPTR